jgi:hypothetical protein
MSETPQGKVSIHKHFEEAVAACEVRLKDVEASQEIAERALKELEKSLKASLKAANAEIEKTDNLIETLAGEDPSIVATLKKKSLDLRKKLELIVSDHENSEQNKKLRDVAVASVETVEAAKSELLLKRKQHEAAKQLYLAFKNSPFRKKPGVVEAIEVDTVSDAVNCYLNAVPIVVELAPKAIGTVEKVHVYFGKDGSHSSFNLSAVPGQKYLLKQIPSSLDWLRQVEGAGYQDAPNHWQDFEVDGVRFSFASSESDKEVGVTASTRQALAAACDENWRLVYFVKEDGLFYTFDPKEMPSSEVVTPEREERDWNGRVTRINAVMRDVSQDASCIFADISNHVEGFLGQLPEEFLNLKNTVSVLGARVRVAVDAVASTESLFLEQRKRLGGAEINNDVGAYWDAFIAAPWERCIEGNVAMLKHLCERKVETPHVWSNDTKGHYGLRVRTRDHTWIVAELFCPPASLAPVDPVAPESVAYLACESNLYHQIVKVGPCYLMVKNR